MTDTIDLVLGVLTVCEDTTPKNHLLKKVEFPLYGAGEEYQHSESLNISEIKELITYLKAWCNKVGEEDV